LPLQRVAADELGIPDEELEERLQRVTVSMLGLINVLRLGGMWHGAVQMRSWRSAAAHDGECISVRWQMKV